MPFAARAQRPVRHCASQSQSFVQLANITVRSGDRTMAEPVSQHPSAQIIEYATIRIIFQVHQAVVSFATFFLILFIHLWAGCVSGVLCRSTADRSALSLLGNQVCDTDNHKLLRSDDFVPFFPLHFAVGS